MYGHKTTEESLSAGVDPESTLVHRESACAVAYKRLCSPVNDEADGEQKHEKEKVTKEHC